jgi:hypothetical protein
MSEPAAAPPQLPAAPGRETLGERVGDLFHRDAPPALQAVSTEVQALLRGHSGALMHAAAEVLEAGWPGAGPLASKILTEALGLAKLAGIAL